jgi:hypothetical protein
MQYHTVTERGGRKRITGTFDHVLQSASRGGGAPGA